MRLVVLLVSALLAPLAAADDAPFILKRCEAQVGASGPGVVKSCVDRDSAALLTLQTYPRPAVARCEREMGRFGALMVKNCVDQGIKTR